MSVVKLVFQIANRYYSFSLILTELVTRVLCANSIRTKLEIFAFKFFGEFFSNLKSAADMPTGLL